MSIIREIRIKKYLIVMAKSFIVQAKTQKNWDKPDFLLFFFTNLFFVVFTFSEYA